MKEFEHGCLLNRMEDLPNVGDRSLNTKDISITLREYYKEDY